MDDERKRINAPGIQSIYLSAMIVDCARLYVARQMFAAKEWGDVESQPKGKIDGCRQSESCDRDREREM